MESKEKIEILIQQWGAAAMFCLAKSVGLNKAKILESMDKTINYLNNDPHTKFYNELPEKFDEMKQDELENHKKTIETLIHDFLSPDTHIFVGKAVIKAIRFAIVFIAKVMKPNKIVTRNRTPLKGGLSVPQVLFEPLESILVFMKGILLSIPLDQVGLLGNEPYDTLINILFKRKNNKGPEGEVLNYMSNDIQFSQTIWENIGFIARQKQTPKLQVLLTTICNGIEYIRNCPTATINDMINIVGQLKGKWGLPIVLPLITKSINYLAKGERSSEYESFVSTYYQNLVKFALDNPTEEWIRMLLSFMNIISNKDFTKDLQKIVQVLNKNVQKFTPPTYFNFAGILFNSASGRKEISSEVFKLFFKAWFDKKGLLSSSYTTNIEDWIQITPQIHKCAPEDLTDFFKPFISQGTNYPNFKPLLNTFHMITTKTKENLNGLTHALSPVIKEIIGQGDIPQETLQLVAPLMSILWQNESDMHGLITSLMSRLVKNNDIAVLRHSSTFFCDIMENYPVGTMPINLITTFATQFLKKTDVDNAAQQIVSSFQIYQSFFRSFLVYIERGNGAVDEESWQRVLRATESKLITYSFFPSQEVKDIVQETWEMCKSPIIDTFTKIKPLAKKIENINNASLKEMSIEFPGEGFEQRFSNIALFFNGSDGRSADFRGAMGKFLYVMMKPEYFQGNEGLMSQVIPKILRVIGTLKQIEIFDLTLLVPTNTWPLVISELAKIDTMHIRSKVKVAWAMSCNRHFVTVARNSKLLQNEFAEILLKFIALRAPNNDNEQAADTSAAEFCSSFIRSCSDLIADMPQFANPYEQLTQIIARLNPDSITLPDISHVFSILELVHTYVDTWKLTDEAIEGLIDWVLYIALKTKGSALLQYTCHDLLHSIINRNTDNLSVILRCCFRASIYTTAHVASAIASSDISPNDLAILALGLCGRPNIICRAIASEIANKSANASFSPLAYLEPNFEENVVEHYMKTLDPESMKYVFSQLPEVVGNSGAIPSALPQFDFIQQRFASISRIETIEKLFELTAVTDFADLTPIKPLISLWDKVFKSPPVPIKEIFEMLIKKVSSLTNATQLTATCVAFSRAFLISPKPTAQFLYSKLRVIQDRKITFDDFVPTTEELVASAAISYIFTLETDSQRFNVCWMGQIHFLLTWAIFLRFNPLYEYYQLPPLLMSSMHAAVPTSSLPLFVMLPSQCVANSVYLPFRHSTEFTTSQMEMLVATLKKFTMLTADLFIDVCAEKAPSLTKYSSDFWLLFANFFQPRHSSVFLNKFMESAQAGDLATVGLMLPVLTGVVKQKAPAQHVGGFIVVIIFVITTTHNAEFLKLITKHLPGFVDAVENSADAATISSTLDWVINEHGSQTAVVEGVLPALIETKSIKSKSLNYALSFLHQLSRLLAFSTTKFSITSGVLFIFDGIKRIQSGLKESMISQSLLGIEAPNSYEDLADLLKKYWPASSIPYLTSYVLTWAAGSAFASSSLIVEIVGFIKSLTNSWTQPQYLSSISGCAGAIAHTMLSTKPEVAKLLSEQIVALLYSFAKTEADIPDLVKIISPLVSTPNGTKKADPASIPELLPKREHEATLVEVCEFIKSNILE